MRREERKALEAVDKAIRTAIAIADLPKKIGSKVRWPHNGVIWVRKDDDQWIAEGDPMRWPTPSEHVVSLAWVPVEEGNFNG